VEASLSISDVVTEAVRMALAEDADDLRAKTNAASFLPKRNTASIVVFTAFCIQLRTIC
jgi:hypothetical protein